METEDIKESLPCENGVGKKGEESKGVDGVIEVSSSKDDGIVLGADLEDEGTESKDGTTLVKESDIEESLSFPDDKGKEEASSSKDDKSEQENILVGADLKNEGSDSKDGAGAVKESVIEPNKVDTIIGDPGEDLNGNDLLRYASDASANPVAMFDPNDLPNPTWQNPTEANNPGHRTANAIVPPAGFSPYHSSIAAANGTALFRPNSSGNHPWKTQVGANAYGYPMQNLNWKAIANRHKESKYPEDCYSFIALHRPFETKKKTIFFLFGLLPFVLQMMLLLLLAWSETNSLTGTIGENDNPDKEEDGFMGVVASFVPSNASKIVRSTQVVALATYIIFPDQSLQDVFKAAQLFPLSSNIQNGEPVASLRFASLLRGIQGVLAIFVTLLLVATSDSVVDIILNFTAVNFISNLDDYGFSLAMSGEFGPTLQTEAEIIANTDLPPSLSKVKASKYVYNRIVMGLTTVISFSAIIFVISAQKSDKVWVTKTLRVQFQDKTGLNEYSGCFDMDHDPRSIFFERRFYSSHDGGPSNSSFGYCRKDRQWILFKGNEIMDPCLASKSESELARSAKTDTFDISTSFDSPWVSASGTPLDMYFFGNETELLQHCPHEIGDGICDSFFFNRLGYGYDGGDCCSSTCTGSKCGGGGFTSLFGSNISGSGIHFPSCENPVMVPLTIQLNSISSSRDPKFAVFQNEYEYPWGSSSETEWRSITPSTPYFALDCAEKNVLTVYIEPSMVNHSETVMVDDGANCTLVVRNTSAMNSNITTADPIWLINYTLFHGDKDTVKSEPIPILTQHSSEKSIVNFKRIPNCYFEILESHLSLPSIYAVSDPSTEAVEWLSSEEDSDGTQCEDDFFIERFALSTIFFSLKGSDLLVKQREQCTWPSIICKRGQVTEVNIQWSSLEGLIPSEVKLLTSLEVLNMPYNQITSISSDIGMVEDLKKIFLTRNQIKSIPTEIGLLTELEQIDLTYNDITSIPTEIGLLTNLKHLELAYNQISSVPSQLGLMTNFEVLDLRGNSILSIPSEIASMTNLIEINFSHNPIVSIPSEIGTMTSLTELNFRHNINLTSIPSAIGLLTNLEKIDIDGSSIRSIPSEIGLITNLREFQFDPTLLSSIPSEIKFLTSLNRIYLPSKNIEYIPSEVGSLVKMHSIILFDNKVTSIPSEIGFLTKLARVDLTLNQIVSIPSEIGLLTNLQFLELAYNDITSIPSEAGLLTDLRSFTIEYNNVSFIPSEIGLMTNEKFTTLIMNWNSIASIPSDIGMLTNIQTLEIGYNQIASIPTEIGDMSALEKLYMDYNHIESIPSEIALLSNLTILDLTNNEIRSIPSEIGLMSNLKTLNLAYNLITSIPSELQFMTNLQTIDLGGNPIKTIPSEIGLMPNLESIWLLDTNITALPSEIESMNDVWVFDYSIEDRPRCDISAEFSGCPLIELSLSNNCNGPLQVAKFLYAGGSCYESLAMLRMNATCEDFNGGPPPEWGALSYITVVSNGGKDVHFAGNVLVGDFFTINANKTYDTLSDDLVIQIFSRQGGSLLQTVNVDFSCKTNLFLADPFGAVKVYEWIEANGRELSIFVDETPFSKPTYDIPMLINSYSSEPLRITSVAVISRNRDVPLDNTPRVGGQILQPGAPALLSPGAPMHVYDRFQGLYVLFGTVFAETLDGEEECNAYGLITCIDLDFMGIDYIDNGTHYVIIDDEVEDDEIEDNDFDVFVEDDDDENNNTAF